MIAALAFVAGLLLGTTYFSSMRWTTERLAIGRGTALTIAAIAGRFVLLGVVLALASRQGALPLLLMALGVFIARAVVLRWHRITPA